ncbi:MAG TPA: DUF5668 domain-containing protein [Thermoanaerobaculia bacterium]|jgi:hypothetical protein
MGDRDEALRISRLIGGGLLLLAGVALALGRFGVLPETNLGDFWPLLLVWAGAARMFGPGRERFASGAVVAALGAFFLLERFGWIEVSLGEIWPVFLIVGGVAMILGAMRGDRSGPASSTSAPQNGGQS